MTRREWNMAAAGLPLSLAWAIVVGAVLDDQADAWWVVAIAALLFVGPTAVMEAVYRVRRYGEAQRRLGAQEAFAAYERGHQRGLDARLAQERIDFDFRVRDLASPELQRTADRLEREALRLLRRAPTIGRASDPHDGAVVAQELAAGADAVDPGSGVPYVRQREGESLGSFHQRADEWVARRGSPGRPSPRPVEEPRSSPISARSPFGI